MRQNTTNSDRARVARWVVLVLFCFCVLGCGKDPAREIEIKELQQLSQRAWVPPDAKERIHSVLEVYQDHIRSPQPILIMATLIKSEGRERHELGLLAFDQHKDLAGFVVRETSHDPNGAVIVLEERYPIFAHYPLTVSYHCHLVPVLVRDDHQRKDEKQWAEYLAIDWDRLVKARVRDRSSPTFWDSLWGVWNDTLPPVWISLPEQGRIEVSVWVFDRAGRESNVVNLLVNPTKQPDERITRGAD
jgi:hypothetical protein